MRILILQFVPPARAGPAPEFRHDLGVAVAMLRADGFDVGLLPLDAHRPDLLHQAITQHRATRLLVDIPPTHITAARHSIVDVAEKHFLPVTVVGRYATCQPEKAISIPGVTAMIPGEYERPVLRLYQSIRDGSVAMLAGPGEARSTGQSDIAGVWFNSEDGLVRNEPAALEENLDGLPFPDRDIFDYRRGPPDRPGRLRRYPRLRPVVRILPERLVHGAVRRQRELAAPAERGGSSGRSFPGRGAL